MQTKLVAMTFDHDRGTTFLLPKHRADLPDERLPRLPHLQNYLPPLGVGGGEIKALLGFLLGGDEVGHQLDGRSAFQQIFRAFLQIVETEFDQTVDFASDRVEAVGGFIRRESLARGDCGCGVSKREDFFNAPDARGANGKFPARLQLAVEVNALLLCYAVANRATFFRQVLDLLLARQFFFRQAQAARDPFARACQVVT